MTKLHRRKRLPIAATILLLAFAVSVVQYSQIGEVSWITDSFRSVETTAKELIGSADANGLTDKLGEYGAKASQAFTKLGEEAQSATGLRSGTNTKSNSDSRSGISGSVMGVTDGDTIKVLDANHAQLLAGMAWWYRYYAEKQPPEDRGRYESAEDEAKARGGACGLILTR